MSVILTCSRRCLHKEYDTLYGPGKRPHELQNGQEINKDDINYYFVCEVCGGKIKATNASIGDDGPVFYYGSTFPSLIFVDGGGTEYVVLASNGEVSIPINVKGALLPLPEKFNQVVVSCDAKYNEYYGFSIEKLQDDLYTDAALDLLDIVGINEVRVVQPIHYSEHLNGCVGVKVMFDNYYLFGSLIWSSING